MFDVGIGFRRTSQDRVLHFLKMTNEVRGPSKGAYIGRVLSTSHTHGTVLKVGLSART